MTLQLCKVFRNLHLCYNIYTAYYRKFNFFIGNHIRVLAYESSVVLGKGGRWAELEFCESFLSSCCFFLV